MLLTITPNPALDRILTLTHLNVGAVNRATDVRLSAGGKGINVARAAQTLGADVLACAPLGGSTGDLFTQLAAAETTPIRLRPFTVEPETRTATILLHQGDMTVINEAGTPMDVDTWAEFVDYLQAEFEDIDALCVCGSYPPSVDEIGIRALLNMARSSHKPVWIDASGIGLHIAYDMGGMCLKINSAEIGTLLNRTVHDTNSALDAAQAAYQHTQAAVIVTLGAQGAVMVSDTGRFIATPPPIQAINPIGSGDSMLAAMMIEGATGEGLRRGVAAGTANAMTQRGGGHFTRVSFEQMLHQTTLTVV